MKLNFSQNYIVQLASILLFLLSIDVISQKKYNPQIAEMKVIGQDTSYYIKLPVVSVFATERAKKRYWNKYSRLVRYVKKVYPYSKLAGRKYKEVTQHLSNIEKRSKKRKYVRWVAKELINEHEEDLKNLTIIQGKILVKLLHRELGITSYEILQELKGSFSAFMWQSLARLVGSNLKATYDAKTDDAMIEEIIMGIERGEL